MSTPTVGMITSFTSYQKLLLRGGVGVGGQTIQDITNFHDDTRIFKLLKTMKASPYGCESTVKVMNLSS